MTPRRPPPDAGSGGRSLRVAFLTPSLNAGGAERQMLLLAELLPRPAFELSFILMWERGAWAAEADALGIPIHVLGLRPAGQGGLRLRDGFAVARAAWRYVALTRQADIVDAWLVPSYTFAAFLQPLARVPVLVAGRRGLMGLYERKPWFRRAAAAWASRRVDAVVANSHAAATEAIDREHISPAKMHVIPNAVLPVTTSAAERASRREAWGYLGDEIVVGCVANYKSGKGLETLVGAARDLRDRAPALRYVLVGEGPLRPALERQIAQDDLGSVVRLDGWADDARFLYPAFDILVQASESEGMPNVVLEAAAAGLPIVATAVGGTPEIVTPETDGILVPSGDTERLAAAILRLAMDPDLRSRLGRGALDRSRAFSGAQLAERTATLYRALADEPSGGRSRTPGPA